MSNKLFEIETYEVLENDIEVEILKNDKLELLTLSRVQFEKWLEKSDRLDYCYDSVDCFGEHEQETGTMPVDRLFEDMSDETIKSNLYDFIVIKLIGTQVFDIETALNQILKTA